MITDMQRFFIAIAAFLGGVLAALIGYLANVRDAKKAGEVVPKFDTTDFSLKVIISAGAGLAYSLGLTETFGYASVVNAILGAAGINFLLPKTFKAL